MLSAAFSIHENIKFRSILPALAISEFDVFMYAECCTKHF
jgi:hypothetical protein